MEEKKARAEDPMLVSMKGCTLNAYRTSLQNTYTFSYKNLCEILKCNRSWVHRFIRPNVHHIYVPRGIKTKLELNASSWYASQEFISLFKDSIVSCQRRTIWIPTEIMVDSDNLFFWLSEIRQKEQEFESNKKMDDYERRKELLKVVRDKTIKYADVKYKTLLYKPISRPSEFIRSQTPWVDIPVPSFSVTQLDAVHDLRGYGDVDEEIYRYLFQSGYTRIKISVPDQKGKFGEKIYYLANYDFNKYELMRPDLGNLYAYKDVVGCFE